MSDKWFDMSRKSFDTYDEAMEALASGILIPMVRSGTEAGLRRKLDEGNRMVSPLVLDYVKVSPAAPWPINQTMCVVEVVHSCELEEIAK